MSEYNYALWQRQLRRSLPAFALMLALLLTGTLGHSQSTQGSVVGNVKDPGGAVVPNATVTLTNTQEGAARTTTTNSVGDYRFLDVKAGQYTLEIQTQGFEKWQISGVALTVRQELRLDAKLTVGAVQQEINVTGEDVTAIQTDAPP